VAASVAATQADFVILEARKSEGYSKTVQFAGPARRLTARFLSPSLVPQNARRRGRARHSRRLGNIFQNSTSIRRRRGQERKVKSPKPAVDTAAFIPYEHKFRVEYAMGILGPALVAFRRNIPAEACSRNVRRRARAAAPPGVRSVKFPTALIGTDRKIHRLHNPKETSHSIRRGLKLYCGSAARKSRWGQSHCRGRWPRHPRIIFPSSLTPRAVAKRVEKGQVPNPSNSSMP